MRNFGNATNTQKGKTLITLATGDYMQMCATTKRCNYSKSENFVEVMWL